MLYNEQEFLLFHKSERYTLLYVIEEGAQISVGSPARVMERNCDKDRKRARRPKAAH